MTYYTYMYGAASYTLEQNDETGFWNIAPDWKIILCDNGLGDIDSIEAPFKVTWIDVEDYLRFEVEKRNKALDKRMLINDWLQELINNHIEPAVLQEETEYIANIMNYLKFKAEHPEITNAQSDNVKNDKLKDLLNSGLNFSKKKSN